MKITKKEQISEILKYEKERYMINNNDIFRNNQKLKVSYGAVSRESIEEAIKIIKNSPTEKEFAEAKERNWRVSIAAEKFAKIHDFAISSQQNKENNEILSILKNEFVGFDFENKKTEEELFLNFEKIKLIFDKIEIIFKEYESVGKFRNPDNRHKYAELAYCQKNMIENDKLSKEEREAVLHEKTQHFEFFVAFHPEKYATIKETCYFREDVAKALENFKKFQEEERKKQEEYQKTDQYKAKIAKQAEIERLEKEERKKRTKKINELKKNVYFIKFFQDEFSYLRKHFLAEIFEIFDAVNEKNIKKILKVINEINNRCKEVNPGYFHTFTDSTNYLVEMMYRAKKIKLQNFYDFKNLLLKFVIFFIKEEKIEIEVGVGIDEEESYAYYIIYFQENDFQVSFHSRNHFSLPEFSGKWTGMKNNEALKNIN